jgi:hypothetical protein
MRCKAETEWRALITGRGDAGGTENIQEKSVIIRTAKRIAIPIPRGLKTAPPPPAPAAEK